jgi:hypothetical protein
LEKTKVHSATVISRMPTVAFFALAALGCLVLAACSPGADYPSLFPSVHDIPPARAETPLDSNQVQQATEDLISARDRLTAEAASAQGKSSTNSPANSPAKAAANSKTAGKPPAKSSARAAAKSASGNHATAAVAGTPEPGHQAGGRQTVGTDAESAAGTETK